MKYVLCAVATAVLSVGCASTKDVAKETSQVSPKVETIAPVSSAQPVGSNGTSSPQLRSSEAPMVTPLANQKLASTFARRGIKMEWVCHGGVADCANPNPVSIEVTAYAPSFGNSENARERAFVVAEMNAKAKLRHFIHEDINSVRVVNTFSRNIERARDTINSKIMPASDEAVAADEEESNANTGGGTATRENVNRTVRTLTENVTASANGILRGVYVVDSKIVDRQTVAVTIRWDQRSDSMSNRLQNMFDRPAQR